MTSPAEPADGIRGAARRRRHTWIRRGAIAAVIILFAVELVVGWPSLSSALSQLRAPHLGWLAAAVAAELISMGAYARMQQSLLSSAGLRVPIYRNLALAYAAHSLNETLPGGPAFSTQFNYRHMRRFGATSAVASWCIVLSGTLSTTALAVIAAVGVLASNGTPHWWGLAALTAATVLIVFGVQRVTRRPQMAEPAVRAVLARVNRLRHRPPEQGLDKVNRFIEQLGAARLTAGRGGAAAIFAVLNWAFDAASRGCACAPSPTNPSTPPRCSWRSAPAWPPEP